MMATESSLLGLVPGPFVPAGLPTTRRGGAAPSDAAGTVGQVLAAAAESRARMAWGRAETHAREAADLAPRAGVPLLAAAALNELAAVRLSQGITDGVEELGEHASRVGSGAERARALVNRAVAHALAGDARAALGALEEAAGTLAAEDRWGWQLVRLNRAAALLVTGELAAAEAAAADALRAGRREKEESWAALASLGAACVYRARGTRNLARTRLLEAVRVFARLGEVHRAIQCHYLLGEIAYEAEDPIRAGSHYRDGLALARPAGAVEAVELLSLRFEHR